MKGPISLTKHTIYTGDARDMRDVADRSVHLIVTSPPYWQLKDYGTDAKDGQIGFYDSYEDYINNLNLVWQECYRVLHKGCRLCVNIGDQFARSVYYGRYKVIPIRTEIIRFCETIGMDYMGAIIWQKVTTTHTTGGAAVMGSYPYPRNGIIKIDYEFILIFKKLGTPPKVSKELKEQSKLTDDEWNRYFYGHWNFAGERQSNHLAAFPIELPYRLIRMFSFVGETVLDPFLGSGTTTVAAHRAGRNSLGFEINPEFIQRVKQRLNNETNGNLFSAPPDVHYFLARRTDDYLSKSMEKLPYLYKGPMQFNLKVDPKKMNFGSRIEEHKLGENL